MSIKFLPAIVGAVLVTTSLAAPTATECTATAYSEVASAVASCTAIVLSDIAVPAGSQLDLTKVKPSTTVTFSGITVGFHSSFYTGLC